MQKLSADVIAELFKSKLQKLVEYSGKKSYKILVSSLPLLPTHIADRLGDLKKISSTFGGKRGQKVMTISYQMRGSGSW